MMHLVATNTTDMSMQEGMLRRGVMAIMSLLGGAGARGTSKRHMRLIETLPLGAKRQLLLVSCDGERFLIGTGPESVQSILRVRPESGAAVESSIAKETV